MSPSNDPLPRAHDSYASITPATSAAHAACLADVGRHGPPLVAGAGLTIAAAFARQATATPHAIALVSGARTMTYGELLARGQGLAAHLVSVGVGPDVLVGVDAGREVATIVALVGVMLAGGGYVPLDADLPPIRLDDALAQTRARCVLALASQGARLAVHGVPVVALDPWVDGAVPAVRPESLAVLLRPWHLAYCTWSSGSTGRPKGILTTHAGVVRLVLDASYARLGPGETLLQAAPLSFDASTFEIWGALLTGARLVLAPPGIDSFAETAALVRRHGVTTMWLTAALFHRWCDGPIAELRGLRQLLAGGDVLRPDAVCAALARLPGCRIVNGYGPTETTTFATCHVVPPDFSGGPVPIGRPIQGTTIRLLDDALRDVADGEVGEICIGGAGLARGYLDDAAATAAKFVPAPGGVVGERLYRSGDLGRWRADGELEFLGRIDRQVKIRGMRVEPGEVERVLVMHPAVREALVVAQSEAERFERRLVAHVVAVGERPTVEALRAHLRARLPEALVPSLWSFLDEMPLQASGKIDTARLPLVQADRLLAGVPFVAPRSALEARVAETWAHALGVERVGIDDRFLALGGTSLQALAIAHALRDTQTSPGVRIPLPLGTVTLGEHVAAVERAHSEAAADAGRIGAADDDGDGDVDGIDGIDGNAARASYTQQQLWFLEQQSEDAWRAYRFQARLDFDGPLDATALRTALDALVARHAILRTTFTSDSGVLVQRIAAHHPARLRIDDLAALDEAAQATALEALIAEEREHRFDLGAAPPVRWRLATLGLRRHVLLQTEHHLLHDGQSFRILVRELGTLYAQALQRPRAALPRIEASFVEHCREERRWLAGRGLERERADWAARLADLSGEPPLFRDLALPPPANGQRPRGGQLRHPIAGARLARIDAAASALGVSRFAWMFAAWAALCGRLARRRRFLVGTALACRPGPAWAWTAGPFVNMVPVPARPQLEQPFDVFAREVADDIAFALARGDVPLGEIVHGLGLSPRLRGTLPFNIGFSFHDSLPLEAEFPDLACRVQEALPNGVAKFDLDVVVIQGNPAHGHGAEMLWEYDGSLFDAPTVARMAAGYDALIDAALAEPALVLGRLPVTSEDERGQALALAGPACDDFDALAADVMRLVAAQAQSEPHAPAVAWAGETMTRGALQAQVHRLAGRLAQAGARAGSVVAVLLPRGFATVAVPLAVLEAGGIYLPLNAHAPPARLAEMLADSQATLLLTHSDWRDRRPRGSFTVIEVDKVATLVDDVPWQRAEDDPAPADDRVAYAIYTSGSTGRPKAVRVGLHALATHVQACITEYGLGPQDRTLLYADASVDTALEQTLVPLAAGACVVVAAPGAQSLHELARFIHDQRITVADLPTALWHAFVREDENALRALPLRLLLVGGEPALRARRPQPPLPYRVLNAYGPTEATITACVGEIGTAHHDSVGPYEPIGRPLAGARAYLLDDALAPVPRGLVGELCLSGPRLALDYLGRPELTRALFVADPFGTPGARLYRTGDLARWLPDGRIEFVGRVDGQLKVRGFRVEAGEVEAALAQCTGVREAVVHAQDDGLGGRRLVAVVTPLAGATIVPSLLARLLRERLPDAMIPVAWRVLEQLPRTSGGKIDRRALAAADVMPQPPDTVDRAHDSISPIESHAAPADATLREVLAIVRDLLPEARPAPHDDLVGLGLHSVLILRFLAQCRQRLAATLKVRDVYRLATPEAIARHVVESR